MAKIEAANAIKDTTSWEKPRTLENLPEFLEEFSGNAKELGEAPETKGSPHTVVVAGAGLRAAELVRALRKFQKKGNPVAKLVSVPKSINSRSGGTLTPLAVCQAYQDGRGSAVPGNPQDWHRCRNSGATDGSFRQWFDFTLLRSFFSL